MEITVSLKLFAILFLVIGVFFIFGLNKFTIGVLIRLVHHQKLQTIIEKENFYYKLFSGFSDKKYYLSMIGLPVGEEIVFRLLPIGVLYYFKAPIELFLLVGIISSVGFGMAHYKTTQSFIFSVCIQGLAGIFLFSGFVLMSEAYSLPVAFASVTFTHLFNNLIINFLIQKPLYNGQDWRVRHSYEVLANRDLEKEFDAEWEKEKAQMDKADEELLAASSGQ